MNNASIENATWYALTILFLALLGILIALYGTRATTHIYREARESVTVRRASRVILALESVMEMWLFVLSFVLLFASAVVRVFWDSQTDWSQPIITVFTFSAWLMVIAACAVKQLWWVIEQRVLSEIFALPVPGESPDSNVGTNGGSMKLEVPTPAHVEVHTEGHPSG